MAADPRLRWWLLPGNHDSLAAGDLWQRIAREAPPNVRPLLSAEPVEIAPGAFLLPAPCTQRRPGRDLTAGMAEIATPAGALRIGLAHGAVQSFSEDGNPALIPPDRAETAGLAFLALGDWHGQLGIGPRTWYAGTPEADGFKHAAAPGALLVTLAGAAPAVDAGRRPARSPGGALALDLLPGDDPAARLAALLPPVAARRDTLAPRHRHRPHRPRRRGGARPGARRRRARLRLPRDRPHRPRRRPRTRRPRRLRRPRHRAARRRRRAARRRRRPVPARGGRAQAALAALSRLYAFAGDAA